MDNIIEPNLYLESVKEILKEILGLSDLWIELTMDTSLIYGVGKESLDLSSIDFVELIVRIEDLYNITFNFDVTIQTLQDLFDYITMETEKNNGAK